MIGTADGSLSDIALESTDGFNDQKKGDINRFYERNGYDFRGVRTFNFVCCEQNATIEYRFDQTIENNTLVGKYERFSERFITTIHGEQFAFESMEEATNFIYHIHRAIKFKRDNEPVVFALRGSKKLNIQTTHIENDDIQVRTSEYYRDLPEIEEKQSTGIIDEKGRLIYWVPTQKTVSGYGPKMSRDGEMSMGPTSETIHYNQSHALDPMHSTEGETTNTQNDKEEIDEIMINETIIDIINNS